MLKFFLIILLIPIVLSCYLKQNIIQENELSKAIDDFVVLYKENSFEKSLKSILIYYEKDKERIFISDIPFETLASFEQENQLIGNYKNIYFEMYATEINTFKNPDFQIYTKEEINQLFPKLMLEYNPKIEVIYNFKNRKKTIKKDNSTEEEKF